MMSNSRLREEILNRLSLQTLFDRYHIQPGRTKGTYHCPFHDDKHPSLSIKDGFWKCHAGCGQGNGIDLIQKVESLDNKEAFKRAADLARVELKPQKPNPLDEAKTAYPLQKKHYNYLLNVRGIKKITADKLKLRSRRDYILFPQHRKGEFVGYKLRHITDKSKMKFEGPDRSAKFWPDDRLRGKTRLWIVSGEYEACRLSQEVDKQGLSDTYAVLTNSTGETSYPKDMLEVLKAAETLEEIHICYDHDKAGVKGAKNIASALLPLEIPVHIHYFPDSKPESYDLVDFFKDGATLQDVLNLKSERFTGLVPFDKKTLDTFSFKEPASYSITADGIYKWIPTKEDFRKDLVSQKPVLILSRAINTDEKSIRLELVYKINHAWERIHVERGTISDSRKILGLSEYGFPVHSGNARKMVEYLHTFENENLSEMPTVYLTHTNGWKEFINQRVFSLGANIFGLKRDSEQIAFLPEAGFESFTNALHCNGTLEEWRKTIQTVLDYPRIAFALYASFATPLLSIVDAPNFIIHYWGDTSMGKTTTLEIAASVWGNPSREGGGLVTSWNNTQVFVERIATFFNDLPLCLDDCQTTDDRILSQILYMIANSVGRGRGAKYGGVQALSSWRTICFSTGEKQLTESTQYDGAKARTIELAGSPFGRGQGARVNAVKAGIRENYGHAGMVFMGKILDLLNTPDGRQKLREQYRQYRDELAAMAQDEIGDRLAHYFAVVQLAGELASQHLGLHGDCHKTVKGIFNEVLQERLGGGDMATRALQEVVSFAQANIKRFMGKADQSINEYYGIWRDAEYIAFYPHKLQEFLGKSGFTHSSVLRSWSERGWIKAEKQRTTYKVWYQSEHHRMIVVKWSAIYEVL